MILDPKYSLVTGYPKAGNTWIGIMISYVIRPKEMIIGNVPMPNSRIFTHCIPRFNHVTTQAMKIQVPGLLRNKRVILLVRHPGDILVSLYMHNVYREKYVLYSGSIDEMVYDKTFGLSKIFAYYQWWQNNLHEPQSIYLVKYEDLLENPFPILKNMLKTIGIYVDDKLIQKAIKFSNFRHMQNMEKTNHLNWSSLHLPCSVHKNGLKVRKGKIGQYKIVYKSKTVDYINEMVNQHMLSTYGYTS